MLLSFLHRLLELCFGHFDAVLEQEIVVVQFIACYHLRVLSSISDDSHLIIEGDEAYLSVGISLVHMDNLLVDG